MTHIAKAGQFRVLRERHPHWVQTLQQYNVRHVEQLASLLLSPTGRQAIEMLRLPVKTDELAIAVDAYLAQANMPGLTSTRNPSANGVRLKNSWSKRSTGYLRPSAYESLDIYSELPDALSQQPEGGQPDSERVIASQEEFEEQIAHFPVRPDALDGHCIYPDGTLPPVKDQEYRGTCVAFATTALLQGFIENHVKSFTRSRQFSEQYLYYRAKSNDPNKTEDGSLFSYALQVLVEHGVCAETYLPYRGYNDWGHSLLFDKPQSDRRSLDKYAEGSRISDFIHLPRHERVATIKNCLRRNLPVGIGVLTFQDAWDNDYTIQKGEVELPIVAERDGKQVLMDTCTGAHAITVYGYQDDPDPEITRPGGGSFIFRNSWGNGWASDNDYGRGYGNLPYEYVERYCLDACIITGLQDAKDKKKS
jgi:C1A family cysteine protease